MALSAFLRLVGDLVTLFLFTVSLNIGIGILNITIPAWVKQTAPDSSDHSIVKHDRIMFLTSGLSIIMSLSILNTGFHWK